MSDKPKPIKVESTAPVTKKDNPDGSASITSEGPVALHIDSIRAVGIENLVEVESHTINRVFNSVSHPVKFHGGGEVRFSYNAKGEILEFRPRMWMPIWPTATASC